MNEDLDEDQVPPYAILSHTWEADQEVTFEDLNRMGMRSKNGYKKLRFCREQVERDGLQHFWVDSCCINKANRDEHERSIMSMFRWYSKAQKCYVYLADVYVTETVEVRPPSQQPWIEDFRNSRWFTRGWTLQELLAPNIVEFFSANGIKLGDKQSLSKIIHDRTNIPIQALQGPGHMFQYSSQERLLWISGRETRYGEDAAYAMMDIVDVSIHPILGEGRRKAFRRLMKELDVVPEANHVRWLFENGLLKKEDLLPHEQHLADSDRWDRASSWYLGSWATSATTTGDTTSDTTTRDTIFDTAARDTTSDTVARSTSSNTVVRGRNGAKVIPQGSWGSLPRFRQGDVVNMPMLVAGIRRKGVFIIHAARYNAARNYHEYQIKDENQKLYSEGAWIRERDLRL